LKVFYRALIGVIVLSLLACSQGFEEKKPAKAAPKAKFRNGEKPKVMFHGDMDTSSARVPGSPVLAALKSNHLGVSATKTIGEAFDSYTYATKKEWRETPTTSGTYYIDFICRLPVSVLSSAALKEGVATRALEIKFAIQKDGVTYIAMARRIEIRTDGMEHTIIIEPVEINRIVADIYGNREIVF
jgi:hypothetical protein